MNTSLQIQGTNIKTSINVSIKEQMNSFQLFENENAPESIDGIVFERAGVYCGSGNARYSNGNITLDSPVAAGDLTIITDNMNSVSNSSMVLKTNSYYSAEEGLVIGDNYTEDMASKAVEIERANSSSNAATRGDIDANTIVTTVDKSSLNSWGIKGLYGYDLTSEELGYLKQSQPTIQDKGCGSSYTTYGFAVSLYIEDLVTGNNDQNPALAYGRKVGKAGVGGRDYTGNRWREADENAWVKGCAWVPGICCSDKFNADQDIVPGPGSEWYIASASLVNGESFYKYHIYPTDTSCQDFIGHFTARPPYGWIDINKGTAEGFESGNPNYSLKDAQFGVFKDSACTQLATTITLNDKKYGKSGDLDPGQYYVKETKAAKGYKLNPTVYPVTVEGGQTTRVNPDPIPNTPVYGEGNIGLQKVDAQLETVEEDGDHSSAGAATFKGAQYTWDYYYDTSIQTKADLSGKTKLRNWVMEVDDNGRTALNTGKKISGDAFYKNKAGQIVYPLGTYVVHETKAPEGYLLSEQTFIIRITQNGDNVQVQYFDGDTGQLIKNVDKQTGDIYTAAKEQVYRGDLYFNKIAAETQRPMSNIPFILKSKTTGEWHILVTDENGCVSTASQTTEPDPVKHSTRTNQNDKAYDETTGKITDERLLNPKCGVWFSGSKEKQTKPIDELGALPYDTYTLTELRVKANEEYTMIEREFVVSQHRQNIYGGTIENHKFKVESDLLEDETGSQLLKPSENTKLTDTITCTNFEIGTEYSVEGWLVDKATGAIATDKYGKKLTASAKMVPDFSVMKVALKYQFDSSEYPSDKQLVAFVQVKLGDKVVAEHLDINDARETVRFMRPTINIATEAWSETTKEHFTYALTQDIWTDRVSFHNVIKGAQYLITGQMIDASSKEPILDKDGKPIKAATTVVAEGEAGTADLQFRVDTRSLQGKSVNIFVRMYDNVGSLVAFHEDVTDAKETIKVLSPSLHTDLTEKGTESHDVQRYVEQHLIDKVECISFLPGQTYKVKGVLMDAATGKEYLDEKGNPVTAEADYKCESDKDVVTLEYILDTTLVPKDTNLVSFVAVYLDGVEIASHKSLDDERQKVHVLTPTMKSDLLYAENDNKWFIAQDDVILNDEISYENQPLGRKINFLGWLVHTDTGLPVTDGKVSDEKAKEAVDALVDALGGEVTLPDSIEHQNRWEVFFDGITKVDPQKMAQLDRETLSHVAFATTEVTPQDQVETVNNKFHWDFADERAGEVTALTVAVSENRVICHATDIDDKMETVEILRSKIGTVLADVNGSKLITTQGEVTLTDTVEYKTLLKNKVYVLKGKLIDKTSGEVIATAEKEFTPGSTDGTTKLDFTLDTTKYAGHDLVCFEYLYLDGHLAAQHEDINDTNQSVRVNKSITPSPSPSPTPSNGGSATASTKTPKTEDILLFGGIAAALVLGTCGVIFGTRRIRKYRKNNINFL